MKHSACEVNLDGTGFGTILAAGKGDVVGIKTPNYASNGNIILEVANNRNAELIAQVINPGSGATYKYINENFTNDNSPCLLPDGRIASLWLNRPNSSGVHELKIMSADGQQHIMAVKDIDIDDIGLGCGA